MCRWFTLVTSLLLLQLAGCRSPYNMYAPYGPQCVPPPATGAVGQPYYAPPYGTYPQYPTTYPAGSQTRVPAQTAPSLSQQSAVFIDEGGWSSSELAAAPVTNAAPVAALSSRAASPRTSIVQPRPSGQLLASGIPSRLQVNDNLNWGARTTGNSFVAPASAPLPVAQAAPGYADRPPTLGIAPPLPQYAPPIPAAVRAPSIAYGSAVQYAEPTYYPNEYVLDPYGDVAYPAATATYVDPYATESVGSIATAQAGWTERR